MPLRLSLHGVSVGASELKGELAKREALWVDVVEDHGALRAHDALCLVAHGGGPCVVEPGDGTVEIGRLGDTRPRLGYVREMMRARHPWRLDGVAGRVALSVAPPRLVNAALRVGAPMARALAQLGALPSAREAEQAQASFYDAADVLEDNATLDGLSEAEEVLIERWLRPSDRVLDIGCGTGREALVFAARGISVVALDVSARSVDVARARARERGLAIDFRVGPIEGASLEDGSFDAVYFGSDVYAAIPGRENRVDVLRRARAVLRPGGRVLLQAMPPAHRVRALVLDAARAAAGWVRGESVEAGDRAVWYGPPPRVLVRHAFFSDQEVIGELEAAGLTFVSRSSSYVVAEASTKSMQNAHRRSWPREIAAVLAALPRVERLRRRTGPATAAAVLRREAAEGGGVRRDAMARARLGHAIGLCDRLVPFGGGCYRRVLLEMALDAGAANEPMYLGFHDMREGHAWLERVSPGERFASILTV